MRTRRTTRWLRARTRAQRPAATPLPRRPALPDAVTVTLPVVVAGSASMFWSTSRR